jgi:glucose-6-phosphate dehydrogenase assembly protein OpcA
MEAAVRLSLDAVEREVGRLWEEEARRSKATRVQLLTLVALVSEPGLLARAAKVLEQVARVHPSRTIAVVWKGGTEATITADAALHPAAPGGAPSGDAITLEAVGGAREWLPQNIDRLILSDLPVCLWWVGDLPDFDNLFDRAVLSSNLVVVNSAEMDLRDLEKLSRIMARSRGRYALSDLMWIRLYPLQELVARFFDDGDSRACLGAIERVKVEFAPREEELDVASTQAALLFGWIAHVLGLRPESVEWKRGPTWGEVTLGKVVARFEHTPRADVPHGAILRVAIECGGGTRFEIERQEDPQVFRWSRDVPGGSTPSQTLRVGLREEAALLVQCLSRPRADPLFEASLAMAVRIVRPIAPRLSTLPNSP